MVQNSELHTSSAQTRCSTATPDEELLDACRAGDQNAWAEIVYRYERLVYSIPLRLGLSREDAADVMQLTFAAFVETIDRIEQSESVGSWLMTVARRTTWRVRDRLAHEIADGEVGSQVAVELGDAQLVQSLMVHEALAQISSVCSELLRALFAADEPSYAAVANRLGRPVGSIGPMRARCLGQLRLALENEDNQEKN